MPTLVELEQLLDIALTTPDIGTVNFNILRVLLQEILRHLNIESMAIDVDSRSNELKSAYDFIKDGYVEIQSPDARRDRTPARAERTPTVVETEPEEQVIDEQDDKEESKSKTPALMMEETKPQASGRPPTLEGPQESQDSMKFLKPAGGRSGDDHPLACRSSVALIRRPDSFRNLKKMVSELHERVETLESQPADAVRSAASLVRKESRTPAHDFVELINIKRKLEACENSLDGLTEMVDALASDVSEMKELLAGVNRQVPNEAISDIEELKRFCKTVKENQTREESKQLDALADNERKVNELENMLANLKDALEEISKNAQSSKDLINVSGEGQENKEVSEALQKFETHDKQLQDLAARIQEIEVKIRETDAKLLGTEQATSDTMLRFEACSAGLDDVRVKLAGLDKELEKHKSLIEDNEMQIHQLKNTITLLQQESLQRANDEAEKSKEEEEKVVEPAGTPAPRRRAYSTDREELSLIRTMIFDLQEEKDKLKQMNMRLSDELYKKQKHVDDLYNLVGELRDLKADKELLSIGFELKADKREVDCKIGREDFEHYMSLMDQSLKDLLQRLEGHENALTQAMEGITSDVGKKLDKQDVEPLKHYLEARMESMKPKPVEKPPPEEFAAGFRKQFLVNHNCISCDRPVKYAREGSFPPLPEMHSMPGSKSNRPYTTFELEQIRQHMLQGGLAMSKERFELLERQRKKLQKEILHLSGVRNIQELAEVTARACGGVHTLTYPHSQAIVRGLQLNRDEFDFLVPQKDFQPVDILGQDGHIYKGLLDGLPPTLPQIPRKNKSPGMTNPPRNLRRSTTPASADAKKTADEVDSS